MYLLARCLSGVLGLCIGPLLFAQSINRNLSKKPLAFTGNVGVSTNFYSSNEAIKTRPSFAWNVNGNLEGKVGNWTLPLNFVVNQYTNSNTSPHIQAGISPGNKWVRFHIGYRNLIFSPLTFEGQSFRGIGMELYPKNFRFAAFYGRLNKAFNEDTSRGSARLPQYSRKGYGLKAGVGNQRSFFDLLYFRAKDDSNSAARVPGSGTFLDAKENAVLGASFKLTLHRYLTWTGTTSISGLVQDIEGKPSFDSSSQKLKDFMSRFLPENNTLIADFAGQSSLLLYLRNFNSTLGYRRVQPGFESLGTPYMIDDIELISWENNLSTAQGKVNVNVNLSQQHDNLDKNLPAELQTQVGTLNMNTILGQHWNINLNYSGYKLKQRNDRNSLPDSLRLDDTLLLRQTISQYGVSPSFTISNGDRLHFINGSINLQVLNDKNQTTSRQNNSDNISASLNYTLSLVRNYCSFSLFGLYSRYKQDQIMYTSLGPTASASVQLLKNRNLNLQGSFGLLFNSFSNGESQRNTSYSAGSSYRVKHHAFNFFVNYVYTPSNPINNAIHQAFPYTVTTKNMYGGISYTYQL